MYKPAKVLASAPISFTYVYGPLLLALRGQGSTLAMCPLARMHFLGRRASSGHNNSFYAGPRGQWLSDGWQTHVPVNYINYITLIVTGLSW